MNTSTGEAGDNKNYRAPTSPHNVTHKHNDGTEHTHNNVAMTTQYEKLGATPVGGISASQPIAAGSEAM